MGVGHLCLHFHVLMSFSVVFWFFKLKMLVVLGTSFSLPHFELLCLG